MTHMCTQFGLSISNTMMEVRGRILPPLLQYGGRQTKQQAIPNQVSGICGKQFHTGVEIRVWGYGLFCTTTHMSREML
ncbi:hypothetical protein CEXT_681771 [Caerostris extrusa]|uniref:Uncharacterized protein n=1 Tax=Caerostris extrusa TaxID=172846 RepID=A0AAV4NEX4_CAEEX|nr:hypothetical protein CEXT_681771 [Caerostris extrusa]